MFIGHTSVQYLHDVHGTLIVLLMIVVILSISSLSASLNGLKSCIYEVLSSSCSRFDIPLNTIMTSSNDATYLIASDAGEGLTSSSL